MKYQCRGFICLPSAAAFDQSDGKQWPYFHVISSPRSQRRTSIKSSRSFGKNLWPFPASALFSKIRLDSTAVLSKSLYQFTSRDPTSGLYHWARSSKSAMTDLNGLQDVTTDL